ncbi:MAG: hydroxymethylbilane synthase [Actinomycetes bacterium]
MLRLGTRGSALALAQTRAVAEVLAAGAEVELVTVESSGPPTTDKARWTSGLERALLEDEIDIAVHSAKDVPASRPEGIVTAAVPRREDPRDRICGAESLDSLPGGARVGTASPRREALIRSLREDLTVIELRGNVDSRLRKLEQGEADALILAGAGLNRLGLGDLGAPLDPAGFTPAAGQGSLMLECRAGDGAALQAAELINDGDSAIELSAERAVVSALDADCHTAVGVIARVNGGSLSLAAVVCAPDGSSWIRDRIECSPGDSAEHVRRLVRNLRSAGADELLAIGRGETS